MVAQLLQRGILINRTHETVLRFLPPYIIQKKHVDQVIRELDLALGSNAAKAGIAQKKGHKKEPLKVISQPMSSPQVGHPANRLGNFPLSGSGFHS